MVLTLFDMCLDIIEKHITCVESLIGFPDIIGKQIFHACEKSGHFKARNEESSTHSLRAISLFASAYPCEILYSLNIEGEHLMLANYFEHIREFSQITKLDVSSCGLGDDHELLYHITNLQRFVPLLSYFLLVPIG